MANKHKRQTPITLHHYDGKYYDVGSCLPHFPKLIITARTKKEADEVVASFMQQLRDKGCTVHKFYHRRSATLARNRAKLVLCL